MITIVSQAFSVNWEDIERILEDPTTEIHSSEELISIQAFSGSLYNAFGEIVKPTQSVIGTFRLKGHIKYLKTERNHLNVNSKRLAYTLKTFFNSINRPCLYGNVEV